MVGERRPGEILVFTKVLQEDRVPVGVKKRVNNRWGPNLCRLTGVPVGPP